MCARVLRPIQVYAVPAKKAKNSSENNDLKEELLPSGASKGDNNSNDDANNSNGKTFRENFLGICPDLEEEEAEALESDDVAGIYPDVGEEEEGVDGDFEDLDWEELLQQGQDGGVSTQDLLAEKLRYCLRVAIYSTKQIKKKKINRDVQIVEAGPSVVHLPTAVPDSPRLPPRQPLHRLPSHPGGEVQGTQAGGHAGEA